MIKAVILAGGKGTRMGEITKEIPKPMLMVGGKPLLEHQIILLKKYQITDIIILVNHLKDPIISYFNNGDKWGVSIHYHEEQTPLGTVGGIKEIEDLLPDNFIVLYGDVMINMDLSRLLSFHKEKNSEASLVLHPNDHPQDSDLIEIDNNDKVIAVYPKPHSKDKYYRNLVNAAAYVFNKEILKHLERGKKADFGQDIFPKVYSKIRMFGYNTAEYLKDMGTPQRLEEVNNDYKTGKIQRLNYENKRKAIFLDRDGVINIEKDLISNPEEIELYPYTSTAIKKINTSEYLAIGITNQSVIARNLCTIEELTNIHKKLETDLGNQGAKIDEIFYCPHHPDKGYPEENVEYKIECDCRKPKPGMFFQAAKLHNIQLSESFMIGDSERDVIAGKDAGCITFGVMTGYGHKDNKVLADFFVRNIQEAVDFIIDDPYKEHFKKTYSQFKKQNTSPFIITIAGNDQSGKSNMANYLKLIFEKNNHKTLIIQLDNWLLPSKNHKEEMNICDKFQLSKIKSDLKKILIKQKVTLDGYQAHPYREIIPIEYLLADEEIIIIEGTVGLADEEIAEISNYKLFMQIEKAKQKERLQDLYDWKGYGPDDINRFNEKRQVDEYELISKNDKFADYIINPEK